jgi:hypothetical protein
MSNQCLCYLDVIVKRGKVQRCEAIILCLIDGGADGEVGQDESNGSHVAPEGCVVEGIEAIVVGDGVVSLELQQQLNNVITLLGDGIVKRSVTF